MATASSNFGKAVALPLLFGSCLAGALIGSTPARGQDAGGAAQPAQTANTGASAGQPLQASVKKAAILAEAGLKELDETSKYLKRSSMDLMTECERQNYVCVGEPDVIGSMVIPAIPEPSGMLPMGDVLPARKKWIDVYMQQLSQIVAYLQKEMSSIVIPPDKADAVEQPWNDMKALAGDIAQHYQNLQPLTQGPKYDNLKIGREALGIYDDTKTFEELRKKIFHIMKQVEKDNG